jgi:hypothetical protein
VRENIAAVMPAACSVFAAWVNVTAGERVRGAIHVQNVNGWHSRFNSRLVRFWGIASRYLIHYSGWQRVLDARRLTTPAHLLCAAARLA